MIQPSTTIISSSGFVAVSVTPTQAFGSTVVASSVCIGRGVDVTAIGVIFSTVICSAIGFSLWLLFGYIRPKYRQIYAVREWFVTPGLRPKALEKSFWAFLWPYVPLIPAVPKDVSSYSNGRNPQHDAKLFPSDEQLAQRTLWHAFILVVMWSVVGLCGALPLYLVDTPCVADSAPSIQLGGQYSTLQDLSLLRLLNLLAHDSIGSANGGLDLSGALSPRVTVDGRDATHRTEIRLMVLTILVVVVAAFPAVFKLLREYTRLINYRRHWIEVKCGGIEIGWLSKADAPGFSGWGENQLKEYIIKVGLSRGFKNSDRSREGFAGVGANGRSAGIRYAGRTEDGFSREGEEETKSEIDLQGLFTIADTTRLSGLIAERDMILNNLELAETKYINSFQLSTPLPSVDNYPLQEEPPHETVASARLKERISRPKTLGGSSRSRTRRPRHAYMATAAPTSYVAPSSYYKLRDVRGVGRLSSKGSEESLAQRISQRIIGSRFQEIQRDSYMFGRIPMGSQVQPDRSTGALGPVQISMDQLQHGPNYPSSGNAAEVELDEQDDYGSWIQDGQFNLNVGPSTVEEEDTEETISPIGSSDIHVHTRQRQGTPPPVERRSTFPMRAQPIRNESDLEAVPPPHLRLQTQQPFVRPVSGMNHDDLGIVYGSIRDWRSRLKSINNEIAEVQADNYRHIADGEATKGWVLIGRGLTFLPHVQMIEGRSKEDIRYSQLQMGHRRMSSMAFWTVIGMTSIFLGASLVAIAGLVVSPAPGVGHYLKFLQPLSDTNGIGAALATTLAPALVASVLIMIGLITVHYTAKFSSSVSVSAARIKSFQAAFLLLVGVCCVWLIACGSVIFALEAFATSNSKAQIVADGAIYFAAFLLVMIINVAIIAPALILIQPLHLWRLIRRERMAVTPRQRFRTIYPRTYDPTYTTACCLVAVTFAATFSLIFPLIGPAVCLLLLLTLIAHRYLVGYVYARTDSGDTGGLLQIWLLPRLADLVALQPLLLGLILLSRHLWVLGGILIGAAMVIVSIVEGYAWYKLRQLTIKTVSSSTLDSVAQWNRAASSVESQYSVNVSSHTIIPRRSLPLPRSSMASVLEMMSRTLAVMPSSTKGHGPVPLPTEDIDDLTATEQAARTSPNAAPHLPPLPFMTHSEEMQGILYAPELIAPPPIIWLPNDRSAIAESEAIDLFRYHDLRTTLDVRTIDAFAFPGHASTGAK
ncbi:hypothetical protein BU17DRAFT_73534 [Hysterangium stoloniferum]|nr:hypothetical protein BU17DRAFT_73534 [Hysterangium stoloniferum]